MIKCMQTTITLIMFLLCAAPLYAGVEPFYKGEWGMTMDEVQALHNVPPANDPYNEYYESRDLEYNWDLDGQPVVVTYLFSTDLKLTAVDISGYAFTNVSDHVFWEVRDNLQDEVNAGLLQPAEFAELRRQTGEQTYYEWAWLSADTYVDIYINVTPGADLNNYTFGFKFYDNSGKTFDSQFKELQHRAANVENEEKP